MRVFISIELPEMIRENISSVFDELRKKELILGNFVQKDNLHITLKFLGEIENGTLEDVKEKLSKIKFDKFKVKIGGVGVFDSFEFIKVIWVEVLSEEIKKLQDNINISLSEFSSDYKNFNPHITTIRVNKIRDKNNLVEEIKKIKFSGEFEVSGMALMESKLTPFGPVYNVLERFSLK